MCRCKHPSKTCTRLDKTSKSKTFQPPGQHDKHSGKSVYVCFRQMLVCSRSPAFGQQPSLLIRLRSFLSTRLSTAKVNVPKPAILLAILCISHVLAACGAVFTCRAFLREDSKEQQNPRPLQLQPQALEIPPLSESRLQGMREWTHVVNAENHIPTVDFEHLGKVPWHVEFQLFCQNIHAANWPRLGKVLSGFQQFAVSHHYALF